MRNLLAHPSHAVAGVAPTLSLALLLGLPLVLPNHVGASPGAARVHEEIAFAMADIPYAIGSWVAEDVEVPSAAVRMLHANAVLSRRYQNLSTGEFVHLVIVHCADARDIVGHYPPVCYPNAGWSKAQPPEGSEARLAVADRVIPVQVYEFQRPDGRGARSTIRVLNFFVLPDGVLSRRMEDVYGQSQRPALAAQGTSQFQLIVDASEPATRATESAAEILGGLEPYLESLGVTREIADE